jgi:hypothetical protein
VKVGRSALDSDTRHAIEARYPGVGFDWPRILKGQGAPEPAPAPPVRTGDQERRKRPRESRPPRDGESQTTRVDAGVADSAVRSEPEPPGAAAQPPIPDAIIPAHAILGAEGVHRLRTRYADLASRIISRVPDEGEQRRLKEEAERLNPDTWCSEDEVRSALEQYEAVLEAVRAVVGQPRRRRRREDGGEEQGSESV